MIKDLISVMLSLCVAKRLCGQPRKGGLRKDDAWSLAKLSLKLGMLITSVPLLEFYGISKYVNGIGYPSFFFLIVSVGLTMLVLLGFTLEITGNILLDCLILSSIITILCFTLINGMPVAWASLSQENLCRWFIASIFVSLFARAVLWIKEGK